MNWKPSRQTPTRNMPSSWMNLTTSTALLISSSKTFAQNLIPSHGTDGLRQGGTLERCAHQVPHAKCQPSVQEILEVFFSGTFHSTKLIAALSLCMITLCVDCSFFVFRSLCFQASETLIWVDSKRGSRHGGNNWSYLKSCFHHRALACLIPTLGHRHTRVP